MHRIRLIFFLTGVFFLVGCAAPEVETAQTMTGSLALEDIVQDDGRVITEHFQREDDEGAIDIDAEVSIPNTDFKEGIIQNKQWDISVVERVLWPEVVMTQEDNDQEDYVTYIGGEHYKDLDYDTYLGISELDGALDYGNYKLDDYFVNTEFNIIDETNQTEAQRKFVKRMGEQAAEVYSELGLEGEMDKIQLMTSGDKQYCTVWMKRMLEGCQFLDDAGEPVCDNITIAECGINMVNLSRQYEIKDEKEVPVISVDQAIEAVKNGIQSGEINAYITEEGGFDYTIRTITMGYMTKIENGALHFFPVWCFQCPLDDGNITLIALDARNGSVVYAG